MIIGFVSTLVPIAYRYIYLNKHLKYLLGEAHCIILNIDQIPVFNGPKRFSDVIFAPSSDTLLSYSED